MSTVRAEGTRSRLSAEDRRRQLIGIGLQLLIDTPFHELSVDDVAAEAGISRSLLFHYFPTKTDYFRAVARAAGRRFVRSCTAAESVPPELRLTASVEGMIRTVRRRREPYLAFVRGGDQLLQEGYAQLREDLAAVVLEAVGGARGPHDELQVRGWLAYALDLTFTWAAHVDGADPGPGAIGTLAEQQLRDLLIQSLHALLAPPTLAP